MAWKDLNIRDKHQIIKIGVANGLKSMSEIRDAYNKFACGGNLYQGGGLTENKNTDENVEVNTQEEENQPWLSTGNEIADAALGMLPVVGTIMDGERLIRDPSWSNAGSFALSLGSDLLGIGVVRTLGKGVKLAKAVKNAEKAINAAESTREVRAARRVLQQSTRPSRIAHARQVLKPVHKLYEDHNKAYWALDHFNRYEKDMMNTAYALGANIADFMNDTGNFMLTVDNNDGR